MIDNAKQQVKRPRRRITGRRVWMWITSRSRDLAMALIILVSGVAAFDGAHFSALQFHFVGLFAVAFALLPDALMVLSAAKMRETKVHPEQRRTAQRSMRFGLAFSVVTNMTAAGLRLLPEDALIRPYVIIAGTLVYHATVVVILWLATETITKVRQEPPSIAKPAKTIEVTAPVVQPRNRRPRNASSAPVNGSDAADLLQSELIKL